MTQSVRVTVLGGVVPADLVEQHSAVHHRPVEAVKEPLLRDGTASATAGRTPSDSLSCSRRPRWRSTPACVRRSPFLAICTASLPVCPSFPVECSALSETGGVSVYGLVNGVGCIWTGRGRGLGVRGGGGGEHENPGRRRVGWRRRTQSDHVEGNAESRRRKQQKRERQRVRHPQILIGHPTKKSLFSCPPPPPPTPLNGRGHTFSKEGYASCCKSCCLKAETK